MAQTIYCRAGDTGSNLGTEADPYNHIENRVSGDLDAGGGNIYYVAGTHYLTTAINLFTNAASGNPNIIAQWPGEERARVIAGIRVDNNSTYQWTASATSGEYYLELNGGGDPSLNEVKSATVSGYYRGSSAETERQRGTAGSLSVDLNWAWGDNDTLGFNTFYIKIPSGASADDYEIIISQINYCVDTNWGYQRFEGIWFSHGNISNIRARGIDWTTKNCIFSYADFNGFEVGSSAKTYTLENSIFFWSGHRCVTLEVDSSITVNHAVDYSSHLFALIGASVTGAGSMTVKNVVSFNAEAGSIDKKSATAVLTETNNLWYPRMTAAGGAIGYLSTANWATTDISDIPSAAATTESSQSNLTDPLLTRVNDLDFTRCDFRPGPNSPLISAGTVVSGYGTTDIDGTTRDTYSPNIGVYESATTGVSLGGAVAQNSAVAKSVAVIVNS